MAQNVRAKFRCDSVTKYQYDSQEATLSAVCGTEDEEAENSRFNKYTPSGELKILVDNPALQEFFIPGEEYYLDFTPASEEV